MQRLVILQCFMGIKLGLSLAVTGRKQIEGLSLSLSLSERIFGFRGLETAKQMGRVYCAPNISTEFDVSVTLHHIRI